MLPCSHPPPLHDFSPSRLVDVVRGESEADSVTPPPLADATILPLMPAQYSVPSSSDGNASSSLVPERGKKPVWGRTSNGVIETGPVVMGDSVSWPALKESAKTSSKPSSEGLASTLGHVNSPPTARKFSKRGVGDNACDGVGTNGSFSSNGGPSSYSLLSSSAEMTQNITDQPDRSNYSNRNRGSRDSHGWVDQGDRQRKLFGSSRRGNNGNRRDLDRGVHEWSSARVLSGRDFHMQRGHPRPPSMRPPMLAMVPIISPLPFRPFPGPVAFHDFSSQGYYFPTHPYSEAFGGNPSVPCTAIPPMQHPMFFALPDQQRTSLLNQIEYYFSSDNLCKDVYLRKNMDEYGWVSIFLIAGFNRVKQLTDNIQYILDVVRSSDVVEVQGDRVRRRHGWREWTLNPQQNQYKTDSDSLCRTATTNQQSLVSQMESVTLGEGNVESDGESFPLEILAGGLLINPLSARGDFGVLDQAAEILVKFSSLI